MLRAVTPLYGPSQASSFSSSSPGEKKNYSLRCRVQREEQDSSHSLAVFLPDFRQPSKKLKPACVPSSLHIPLLEHCNHWSGSALAQQHKQPSVRQLPKWGQLLGELKVGVEQTSFIRKKSVILTFPEVRQSLRAAASYSHNTYSQPGPHLA